MNGSSVQDWAGDSRPVAIQTSQASTPETGRFARVTTHPPLPSEQKLNGPASPREEVMKHESGQDGFPFQVPSTDTDQENIGSTTNGKILGTSSAPARPRERPSSGDNTAAGNRRSVQFVRSTTDGDHIDWANSRSESWDVEGIEHPSKDRRGGTFFSKMRALASSSTTPSHNRTPSSFTVGGDSIDERFQTRHLTPGLDGPIYHGVSDDEGSEIDADAEQSAPEDGGHDSSGQRKKRKSHRPEDGGTQTAPTTPKYAFLRNGRPNFFPSTSMTPSEKFRPSFLPRRATMNDVPEDNRQGVSEDEGRDRLNRDHRWRKGSAWVHGPRGLSYSGGRKNNPQSPGEERRPSSFRRLTGFAGSADDPDATPLSPWKLRRSDRTSSVSAAKWRQLKAGLKMIGQRRKADNTVDHAKSAELLAELTAGVPAALLLASMFQRDEHGNKRIPILLEQLKVRLTDSRQVDSRSGDRHMIFRIELEYGNGLTRMKWVIHRALRDFANLHARYKLQLGTQKYIQLRADDSRTRLPHFPRSAFPYLRGIRGLESDSEEEAEVDGEGTGPSGGEASGAEKHSKKKRPRPPMGISRRKSSGNAITTSDNASGITASAPARREPYPERQRKKLETYLQQMIRYLIFRPESNRLCKFLELSALGVRLAAEGSYHGKEGLLIIRSGKGVDFRKGLTPSLIKNRHRPKWFSVRHSYVVCVDSPEEMNIYDVFLVDSKFLIQTKKTRLRDSKPKDLAKSAKESAAHPQHHSLKLGNSERKLKLLAKNERQLHQFEESLNFMAQNSIWSKPNRFDSFAPVRSNVFAQWLVDGRDYMWNVSRAISMAKDVIYIHDWWLSPELYMRRPAAISQKWRLDRLLQRKAQEGVKVFVIVYRNINSAIPIDSEYTKFSLLDLHPNVFVQRSPNQFRQNTFFWAHHEKICVVDHMVAFVGGIDLCFGRWDTPQHTVVDDKLTGFEESELPKDADHCQLWPGKDYSNPRVQDFYALDKPYEEMYDRARIPRMPWHDISMQVVGQPARDLTRHFVQRWNYILRQRKPTRPTPFLLPPPDFNHADLEALGLDGTCEVQILRSASWWSIGTPDQTEHSIMNAYIKMIEQSEHFVYVENQFFISSCEVEGTRIENHIGDALVERIVRASQQGEDWRAIIVIPLMPGFQNTVDQQDGTSVRLIMQCQFRSICRGATSIFGRVRAQGIEPEDYIQFYSLRKWGEIGPTKQLVTEQLYIHAKCMVVDDKIAIIGSANINERSMLGSRDSECAAVVRDTDMLWSTMNGEPYLVGRFPHTLRMRLMREHLGVDVDEVMEEERQEEESSKDAQWEHDMDRFHGNEAKSDPSLSDRETENRLLRSKHEIQDELLAKSEEMFSFNHDVDWEQADNPNLKVNKKVTEDARVTGNLDHRDDVEGKGPDRMKQAELAGIAGRRDTVTAGGKEVLQSPLPADIAARAASPSKERSPNRSPSHTTEDIGYAGPPPQKLIRSTTAQLGLPMASQLPPLPNTDDTDIGGPGVQRSASQRSAGAINPLLADMKRPFVDKDCMRDPLNDSFFLDTWHALAENNTKLFRQVFRCMPDNEVKSWKEYKEYFAYAERFSQAQGGGKSKDRIQQDTPGSSGPPGQGGALEKIRMLSPTGEKSTIADSKSDSIGEKLMTTLSPKDHNRNQLLGKIEEWAEEANKAQFARHEKEAQAAQAATAPPGSPVVNDKFPERSTSKDTSLTTFVPLKASSTTGTEALQNSNTVSSGGVTYSDALNKNSSYATGTAAGGTQKRRRRATTRSSRREFHASDDIISREDAEEVLGMVQGHLVLWPYDW